MAKCKKKDIKIKKYWPLFTLLLPALIYTIIFCYGPMYGIIIAFKDFKPKLWPRSPVPSSWRCC